MFEKLQLGDIFPSSVLATKDGKVYSIQREDEGNAIRFVKFESEFFEEISKDKDAVKVDVPKILSLLKNVSSTESITIEKVGDKLFFTDSKGATFVHYEEPKKVQEKFPFEVKDGIPYVSEGTVPLTTKFTADLTEFKSATAFGRTLKTEYYQFLMNADKSMNVKVGDLHNFSDGRDHKLPCEVVSGESLKVVFTYGIPQIADTFRQPKFTVQTVSDSPGMFSEISKEEGYQLVVVVPPYVEED